MSLDFSVFKNNYGMRISENFNTPFRAEFFSVLNRASIVPPIANNTIFDVSVNPIGGAGGHEHYCDLPPLNRSSW